jgi:hypothetical protein
MLSGRDANLELTNLGTQILSIKVKPGFGFGINPDSLNSLSIDPEINIQGFRATGSDAAQYRAQGVNSSHGKAMSDVQRVRKIETSLIVVE